MTLKTPGVFWLDFSEVLLLAATECSKVCGKDPLIFPLKVAAVRFSGDLLSSVKSRYV